MTDQQQKDMAEFGITVETKEVFHYKEFTYQRLDDAIGYAKKVLADETGNKTS